MIININQLLKENIERDYTLLVLPPENRAELIQSLPKSFRECLVDDQSLDNHCRDLKQTRAEVLQENFIPDDPTIMSGDFGEILFYLILPNRYDEPLEGICKWKYKEDRNKAVHYTDIVYHKSEGTKNAMTNDLVVTAEMKTKATKSKKNKIQDAIEGAEDDFLTRLVKTLAWQRRCGVKERDLAKIDIMNRFLRPSEYGEYRKEIKAVLVIDEELFSDELAKGFTIPTHDWNFELLILKVPNLKELYTNIYNEALRT